MFDHYDTDDLIPSRYVILLDINMPRVNGLEVLKRVKMDGSFRSIPVIMLTTTDDDEEIDLCYEHGCNGYIVKYPDVQSALEKLWGFLQIDCVPKIHLKRNSDNTTKGQGMRTVYAQAH